MTDVEITGVIAETGAAEAIPGDVITRVMSTSLDFLDPTARSIRELVFPSLFPGEIAEKEMMVINDGAESINITLQTLASEVNPLGTDLETYLSTFFSIDQILWENSLNVEIDPAETQNIYIRYAPPSTSTFGEKQWLFSPLINDTISGSPPGWDNFKDWQYYDYFPVTGSVLSRYNYPIAITIPYEENITNTDFGDVRFADEDGNELGYCINSKTDGIAATFYIQLINMPENGETVRIYVYTGNPNVLTTSNVEDIGTWNEDWILNNKSHPYYWLDNYHQWDNTTWHEVQSNLTAEFDNENIEIHLVNGSNTEGTAHNINPITGDFTFKTIATHNYRDLLFYFYQSDLNNLILVSLRKRISFGFFWEIGQFVDGTYTVLATTWSSPYEGGFTDAILEVIVVNNTSITIKLNGTTKLAYTGIFPQAGSGWGIYAYEQMENYDTCIRQPAMLTGNDTYEFPEVGDLTGTWKFLTKSIEVKSGILFKEQVLEGKNTPEVKRGLVIDGHLYY